MSTSVKTAVVALAFIGAACAPRATSAARSGDAVLLRFRPEPGQSFRMVTVVEQATSQTSMGRELHTHQVVTIGTRYDVDGPVNGDGTVRVRATTESARLEMDGPTGHVTYDSSDPRSDVPGAAGLYASLVGRTITEVVAPDGAVKIENADSLMSDLLGRMTLPPGMSRAEFQRMLKEQFGDGFPASLMQGFGSTLPRHPVSVGESWTQSVHVGGPLPMHHTMTFTLRARRNGVAIIDMHSETASDSAATRTVGPTSMRTVTKGTGTGTLEVDEATGWTIRSTLETDVSTTVTLERSPAGRQGIPMTVHIVTTTKPAGGG